MLHTAETRPVCGHTLNIDLDFYRLKLRCFSAEETIVSPSPPKSFTGGAGGKEHACQCRDKRDLGSIPGSARSLAGGNGNPLQYSCLENPHEEEEPGGLQSIGLQRVWATLSLRCMSFSFQWLPLVQVTGSRCTGFSN